MGVLYAQTYNENENWIFFMMASFLSTRRAKLLCVVRACLPATSVPSKMPTDSAHQDALRRAFLDRVDRGISDSQQSIADRNNDDDDDDVVKSSVDRRSTNNMENLDGAAFSRYAAARPRDISHHLKDVEDMRKSVDEDEGNETICSRHAEQNRKIWTGECGKLIRFYGALRSRFKRCPIFLGRNLRYRAIHRRERLEKVREGERLKRLEVRKREAERNRSLSFRFEACRIVLPPRQRKMLNAFRDSSGAKTVKVQVTVFQQHGVVNDDADDDGDHDNVADADDEAGISSCPRGGYELMSADVIRVNLNAHKNYTVAGRNSPRNGEDHVVRTGLSLESFAAAKRRMGRGSCERCRYRTHKQFVVFKVASMRLHQNNGDIRVKRNVTPQKPRCRTKQAARKCTGSSPKQSTTRRVALMFRTIEDAIAYNEPNFGKERREYRDDEDDMGKCEFVAKVPITLPQYAPRNEWLDAKRTMHVPVHPGTVDASKRATLMSTDNVGGEYDVDVKYMSRPVNGDDGEEKRRQEWISNNIRVRLNFFLRWASSVDLDVSSSKTSSQSVTSKVGASSRHTRAKEAMPCDPTSVKYCLRASNAERDANGESDDVTCEQAFSMSAFQCPLCHLFCGSFEGVLTHFISSHDRMEVSVNHTKHVNDSKRVYYVTIRPRSSGPPRITSGSGPGEVSAATRMPRKPLVKRVTTRKAPFTFVRRTPHFRRRPLRYASEPLTTRRLYFHSRVHIPHRPHADEFDSDDEVDTSWMVRHTDDLLDEFTDIPRLHKLLMMMWNHYVWAHPIVAESMVESSTIQFCTMYADQIAVLELKPILLKHLFNLHTNALIGDNAVRECARIVNGAVRKQSSSRSSPPLSETKGGDVLTTKTLAAALADNDDNNNNEGNSTTVATEDVPVALDERKNPECTKRERTPIDANGRKARVKKRRRAANLF